MFSAATFTNVNTDTVDLLGAGYALKNLDWSYEYDGSEFPKQQDSGQNPAYSFVRRITVNLVVQVTGQSLTDYWAKRNTLMQALLVADGAQSAFNHGTLTVTPQGGSSMYLDVNVTGISAPLQFDEAAASVSTVTAAMRADRGYWRATSGGAVVYY
jgi:hypothetical protein